MNNLSIIFYWKKYIYHINFQWFDFSWKKNDSTISVLHKCPHLSISTCLQNDKTLKWWIFIFTNVEKVHFFYFIASSSRYARTVRNCCMYRSTHTDFRFLQENCFKATLIILDLPPFCNPAERFIRDFRKQNIAAPPHLKKWKSLCCKNMIPTSCQWAYPNLV